MWFRPESVALLPYTASARMRLRRAHTVRRAIDAMTQSDPNAKHNKCIQQVLKKQHAKLSFGAFRRFAFQATDEGSLPSRAAKKKIGGRFSSRSFNESYLLTK
jgi:hypothetical protein